MDLNKCQNISLTAHAVPVLHVTTPPKDDVAASTLFAPCILRGSGQEAE